MEGLIPAYYGTHRVDSVGDRVDIAAAGRVPTVNVDNRTVAPTTMSVPALG